MEQVTDIGIMVGYASAETEDDMTFTHSMTKNGDLWWLSPEQRQCTSTRIMLTSVPLTKASCSGTRVVRWEMECRPTAGGAYVGKGNFMSVRATKALCLARE